MREIREIYSHNLHDEFSVISHFVRTSEFCSYITMDTEFPGFVYRTPAGASDLERYRDVKRNVDSMKIIQLGLTFYNSEGRSYGLSWQVNFKEFDPATDAQAANSIRLLRNSGIDFEKNAREGVDAAAFSMLFYQNVIYPCRGRTRWITFHGLYDWAYIVRLLVPMPLPNTLAEFMGTVKTFFGNVYDVKHIARFCGFHENMGLMKIAERLGISWEGRHHQAGYDSMLIGEVFWKIKEEFGIDEDNFVGVVHGADTCNLAAPCYFAPESYFPRVVLYPAQVHGHVRIAFPYYGSWYG